ncbi:MAG: nitrogenase component 1 [Clostridiales bacterium]|nr:nitrogenase component 1 [Clostridiales bacterium]
MKESYIKLPVLTGDVSGAASALYELGGMFVIHDPSGCNSTYNTHDEVRWYDMESLIFISGLTDVEAINGDDSRLIKDTVEAASYYKPNFIALANSPIPYLNGTDFSAVCRAVEKKAGIPTFYVETNAMHDYIRGAGLAFYRFCEKLMTSKRPENVSPSDNIRVAVLGATPLDLTSKDSAESIKNILREGGFEVVSCLALDETFEVALSAVNADVSLVVSSAGLRAAKLLNERYDIPYVAGLPVGKLKESLFEALREKSCAKNVYLDFENMSDNKKTLTVIGEPVVMGSLGAAYAAENDCRFRIVAATEDGRELINESDVSALNEEAVISALSDASLIMGDPMYRSVSPSGAKFIEVPHFALSGRLYLDRIKDIMRLI